MFQPLAFLDLPFFPRPPAYEEHIFQLVMGAICIRIGFLKEPLTQKNGEEFSHQGLIRTTLVIFGLVAVGFSVVGFLLDRFWKIY